MNDLEPIDRLEKEITLKSFYGGYPGLAGTAHLIADYIPNCKIYVEPFAGLGRVSKYVKAEKKVLNDMSVFACDYNKKYNAVITKKDFLDCIHEWDSKNTFFLIDPPWVINVYRNIGKAYYNMPVREYYKILFELLPRLKADWILCGSAHVNHIGNGKGHHVKTVINTNKKINGHPIRTKLCSNIPFKKHRQMELVES